HEFNAEGVCIACGYTKYESECRHENYTTSFDTQRQEIFYNEDQHLKIITYNRYCNQCNTWIPGDSCSTSLEDHDYKGLKEKVCQTCGHAENSRASANCQHNTNTDSTEHIGYCFEQYDAHENVIGHAVSEMIGVYCGKCGTLLRVETVPLGSQPHVWDGDTCIRCDFTRAANCTHSAHNFADHEDTSAAPVITALKDVHGHLVQHCINRYCTDCLEIVETYLDDGEIKGHTYENNVCSDCGDANGSAVVCDHSSKKYNDVYDPAVAPVYTDCGDGMHLVQNTYRRYCRDCGTYLESVLEEGKTYAHDYSSGTVYQPKDDICHIAIADVYEHICTECGGTSKERTTRTAMFWTGYVFITLAFLGQLVCAWFALKEANAAKLFYRISLISTSYTGLVVTFVVGGLCMLFSLLPYWIGILVCSIVLALNVVAVIKAAAAIIEVESIDEKIKTQIGFIKSLTADAEILLTEASKESVKAACQKVYEAVRYSDPMSCDALTGIEEDIVVKFGKFSDAVAGNNEDEALQLSDELMVLLASRNKKCRLYK
ncbi:MAG: hypothetical protein J6K99_03435, partial [Peptococcaceae bacterium]|nr:hypothetical protein [Peptococcaceae bacterium]